MAFGPASRRNRTWRIVLFWAVCGGLAWKVFLSPELGFVVGGQRVLVTGAAGYLGREVCCQLLEQGHTVIACVRDPGAPRAKVLKSLADAIVMSGNVSDQRRFTIAPLDVVDADAAGELVSRTKPDAVMHIAAVFRQCADPIRDMAEPNIRGAETMVRACACTDAPPLFLLTSSMAAVRGQGQQFRDGLTHYDHNDYNVIARADQGWSGAYQYSKLESERRACSIADEIGIRIVVFCPSMIIGPERRPENMAPVRFPWMQSGSTTAGVNEKLSFVDVRDVARAHIAALSESAEKRSKRYIVSTERTVHSTSLVRVWSSIRANLVGSASISLEQISCELGEREVHCAERLREELAVECRSVASSVLDMAKDHQASWRYASERLSPLSEAGAAVIGAASDLFSNLFPR